MGPLFSGMFMLVMGVFVSIVVFGVASIVNNRSSKPRSKSRLALLALITSASFWTGGAVCGLVVGWLLSDHGMLNNTTAVLSFFVASLVGGLIAGTLVSRLCWRLAEVS
jgi:MFS family permease